MTVTTPGGTSAPVTFTYDPAQGPPGGGGGNAPTVASVTPSTAADSGGGDTVTITGSGFTTTQAVRFGVSDGSPQGTFTIVSDTELSVIAPAGSGLVDIIVVSSYGESAATIADHFTYPALAPPVVSSIIPGGGYVNDQVTIVGSGFAEGCAVHFGTESAAFNVQSDTIITALAPDLSGVVHVTVSNAGGASAETSADLFTYGGDNLPHTSATNVQKSGYDGWAQGSVTVTLTASVNNGYGIAKTLYQIDNAGIVEYAGPFVISGPGCHQVQYWSVDLRGNVEPVNIGWVNILSASVVPAGLTVTPLFDMVLAEWDLLVAPTTISFRLYAGADRRVRDHPRRLDLRQRRQREAARHGGPPLVRRQQRGRGGQRVGQERRRRARHGSGGRHPGRLPRRDQVRLGDRPAACRARSADPAQTPPTRPARSSSL